MAPARAQPGAERVQIWYRSGPGCPDGAGFIELLSRLGRAAALAGVGDRVDFVVTLAGAEQESSGRLERQSSAGTVAIRDFTSSSCADVAEVLALSLDLALKPATTEPTPAAAPPLTKGWQMGLGAQTSLETELAQTVLPGVAAFFELGPAQPAWSTRLSLRGAYGEPDEAVALRLGLLAARLEACWAWALADVRLGPCGGVDLGLVLAESSGTGGRSDRGLWSDAAAHGRVSWNASRVVAVEAQVGVVIPFVRYDFNALTGATVTDSDAVGLSTALGVSFRL